MEFRKFNPKDIQVPEIRVTSRFDDDTMELFKRSINADPSMVYIVCSIIDGRPILIDGLHRLNEAIHNKWPEINVAIVDGDWIDVLTRNLKLDHLRGKHPVTEMLRLIKYLFDEEKLTIEKIVEKTGFSQEYIEKLILINGLTPYCLESLDQGRIKIGHAEQLTRVKTASRQDSICMTCEMYQWDIKTLRQHITDVLEIDKRKTETPGPTAPPPPVKYKCRFCPGDKDPAELTTVMICSQCAGIIFAANAEADRILAAENAAAEAARAAEKDLKQKAPPPG